MIILYYRPSSFSLLDRRRCVWPYDGNFNISIFQSIKKNLHCRSVLLFEKCIEDPNFRHTVHLWQLVRRRETRWSSLCAFPIGILAQNFFHLQNFGQRSWKTTNIYHQRPLFHIYFVFFNACDQNFSDERYSRTLQELGP